MNAVCLSEEPTERATILDDSLSPSLPDVPATGAVASRCESKQPTAAELTKYGIKVRDFAIESTLPPIAPVYLHPTQIQPNPGVSRPYQEAGDGRKHPRQSLTQPFGVTRQRGFVDLRDYDTDDWDNSIYTPSQPPLSYSHWQAQGSEGY
ncbi:hypothetical protein M378DRAFT_9505, partial [Amanita muscaria Koide BX008]